jgi:hypothetical protein
MRRILPICGLLVALGGCMSTSPPEYARGLDARDPRFNSAQCQDMRKQAASYDPNTVGQFAAGMAASPFGGVVASAENTRRKRFLTAMHQACSTRPVPDDIDPNKGVRPAF